MKAVFAVATVFVAMVAAVASQKIRNINAVQRAKEVLLPLNRLDSYVGSIMNSPHETVFLNLGSIGEDNNYLVLEPIEGGISMRFPAFASNAWDRRQGKYAEKLRETAELLSLELDETSEVANDGTIKAVNFRVQVTGEPMGVADTVENVILRTFQVGSSQLCTFQYANLPSTFSRRAGEEPRNVSAEEFMETVMSLDRVYLGEAEHFIYAIPSGNANDESPYWNSDIWRTDVRKLDLDVLKRIRQFYGNPARPGVDVGSYRQNEHNGEEHRWQLSTQRVAAVRIRLLHISDGRMQVSSDNILRGGDSSDASAIDLVLKLANVKDEPNAVMPSLAVSSEGLRLSRGTGTPIKFSGRFQVSPTVNGGSLAWHEPTILFHRVAWDGDLQYGRNTESMIEASKEGPDFLALEVEWIAEGEQSQPDWAAPQ